MEEPHVKGCFIYLRDIQGFRHALRLSSVRGMRGADENGTETLIVLNGGRNRVVVPYAMENILDEVVEADLSSTRYPKMGFGR